MLSSNEFTAGGISGLTSGYNEIQTKLASTSSGFMPLNSFKSIVKYMLNERRNTNSHSFKSMKGVKDYWNNDLTFITVNQSPGKMMRSSYLSYSLAVSSFRKGADYYYDLDGIVYRDTENPYDICGFYAIENSAAYMHLSLLEKECKSTRSTNQSLGSINFNFDNIFLFLKKELNNKEDSFNHHSAWIDHVVSNQRIVESDDVKDIFITDVKLKKQRTISGIKEQKLSLIKELL